MVSIELLQQEVQVRADEYRKDEKMTIVYSIFILCQRCIKTLPSGDILLSITYCHIPIG